MYLELQKTNSRTLPSFQLSRYVPGRLGREVTSGMASNKYRLLLK